ncbi:hypothetical protein L0668_20115 [Paraglaciecola aquimarina]|uniref:Nucleotide-diphospho-sugar transferase domain-containing protein n=1 Tax=Paraglaciecola algarum TaxID=3050085 RepID=A0ABS9DFP3_9ALTE|nr:hypothetical protein [Paraglaciecola sp. G1-23]MCF2950426.1 hypothetical protein [Paraglaciecola sp. G1-23]
MQPRTLVFSIAINGYQWLYKDCIASHKKYAENNGYHYQVVTRPYATIVGVECCWLKLTLMLEALKAGYDDVFFVDADAFINPIAPKLSSVFKPNKYLYMAKSYSGRYNSGVMLGKNCPKMCLWLQKVIANRHINVDKVNDVGWGENGHIIQYAANCEFVTTIDRRWNNTYDPELKDYIRHFSFGPLRRSFGLNLSHKILARLTRIFAEFQSYSSRLTPSKADQDSLVTLTQRVLKYYKIFSQI